MCETGNIRTIYLDAIQPDELPVVNPAVKDEKERELHTLIDQGFKIRIEVQYPRKLPQIYVCEYPTFDKVTWESCKFSDITPCIEKVKKAVR